MSDMHLSEEDLVVCALEGMSAFSESQRREIHQHLDVCTDCSSCLAEARRELGSSQDGPVSARVRLLRTGDVLCERYRIVRYVASGGMGDVYEASDIRLPGASIAIKTLNIAGSAEARAISRLVREAKVALKVSHPHACRVHHYDVHILPRQRGEVHFLTMEWVEGVTLSEHLKSEGPLTTEEVRDMSKQLLGALDAAHHSGILHRDLKSSNVMLRSGAKGINAVIMDFGLAKPVFESGEQLTTNSRAFLGSANYASPEQVMAETLTPSTDLYSFGIVLFEALTGKLPFCGAGALETALMRVDQSAPLISTQRKGMSKQWDRLVARCLEREPSQRFESADALREAVEALGRSRVWRRDLGVALGVGVAMGLSVSLW